MMAGPVLPPPRLALADFYLRAVKDMAVSANG
jgi:hypothetical protein